MRATRWTTALLAAAAISMSPWLAPTLTAQGGDKYSARLAWVPIAGADRVTGKGTATATLSGKTLAYPDPSRVWAARPRSRGCTRASPEGARGKPVADVTVPKSTSGTFSAHVALTDEQIDALKQGKLYLQLNGDKGLAPDGANLWGWFQR